MRRPLTFIAYILINIHLYAQVPPSSVILHELKQLEIVGSALYVAAHPDDENTRLIAWLANEKRVLTTYLSLTRGDGGQNLIGPEIRESLGIIRTQELLAARKLDGGKQMFSRANDFGYSKTPEETFKFWDREKVLYDVVWAIRKTRPDVIICRFPTDGGGRHGHHTASAILAQEAFSLAGNPESFPEQLKWVKPWQPTRILVNTGRWWNPDISAKDEGVIVVDVGEYNPLLGASYAEIAAQSRTMHKSQGFGSTGRRGIQLEYLEHMEGKEAEKNLFDDIDLSWGRINSEEIGKEIKNLIASFDPEKPYLSVSSLIKVRKMISKISNEFWKEKKLEQVDKIISWCAGIYINTLSEQNYLTSSDSINFSFEITNRSPINVKVDQINIPMLDYDTAIMHSISENEPLEFSRGFILPSDAKISQPYWLTGDGNQGMYHVADPAMIGLPESEYLLYSSISLVIDGEIITYQSPFVYSFNDPVDGEVRRPTAIIPAVTLNFQKDIYILSGKGSTEVVVNVNAHQEIKNGKVRLQLPDKWKVTPEYHRIELEKGSRTYKFLIKAPEGQHKVSMEALVEANGKTYNKGFVEINYPHISTQYLFPDSRASFVKLNLNTTNQKIGYIPGTGDEIPEYLRLIGFNVTIIDNPTKEIIDQQDVIILGIRAYNSRENIRNELMNLFQWVKNGGNLIIQYNTSYRLKTDTLAPYHLKLSRDRVTEENAPVKFLTPDHPILKYPNEITQSDFDNWVQERGLYFPNEWDGNFTPVFGIADMNEEETKGALLVADYGKGSFIYTGISFFRELPAGVPGAFRLMVNLISYGNRKQQE